MVIITFIVIFEDARMLKCVIFSVITLVVVVFHWRLFVKMNKEKESIIENKHIGKFKSDLPISDVISLINIYLTEFNCRYEMLWSIVIKVFYATIIVSLLPNISCGLHLKLPINSPIIFRVLGLCMSLGFTYISLSFTIRMDDSKNTYQQAIKNLCRLCESFTDFQQITDNRKNFSIFSRNDDNKFNYLQPTFVLVMMMSLSSIIVNLLLIWFDLQS